MANQSDGTTLDGIWNNLEDKVKSHDLYAGIYARNNSIYNVAGISMSGLAGLSAIGDLVKALPSLTFITAIFTVLATILNGIYKGQDYATKAEQHRASKVAFESCRNTAMFLAMNRREGRPVEDNAIKALEEAINKAVATEPIIPNPLTLFHKT